MPCVCGDSNLNLRETGILLTFVLGARSQAAARMGRESKHSAWDRQGAELETTLCWCRGEVSVICDVLHISHVAWMSSEPQAKTVFFFFSRGHTLDIEQQPLGVPCHQLSGTKLLATQSSLTGAMSYSSDFLGKEGPPQTAAPCRPGPGPALSSCVSPLL